jgi:hypothetical protein
LFFIVVKSPAPPPLDVIVIVEGVLALMLLVEVLIGLEAAPFFAKDTFYANRIPGRALWDLSELGQFAVSDVTRVVVRSSNNVGIAWLDVRVYSRTGRKARFAGFTRAAMMAVADRRGALLPPKAKAELLAMGGGAEDVVELARSLNLPITMETDPTAGTPPPN